LRAIRATFSEWDGLTLGGVWRALQRLGLGLRSAAVQQYSPDPDYSVKGARLLAVLREAAARAASSTSACPSARASLKKAP
jgi:hypothetical protein